MPSNHANPPELVQACADLIRGSIVQPRPVYYSRAFSFIIPFIKEIVRNKMQKDRLLQLESLDDLVQWALIRLMNMSFREQDTNNPVALVRKNVNMILASVKTDVLRKHKARVDVVYFSEMQREDEEAGDIENKLGDAIAVQDTPEQEAIARERLLRLQDVDAYMKANVSEKGYRLFRREMADYRAGRKTPASVLMEELEVTMDNLYQLRSRNRKALRKFLEDVEDSR